MVDHIKSENDECLDGLGDLTTINTQELFQFIGSNGEINSELVHFDLGLFPIPKAPNLDHLNRYPVLDLVDTNYEFDVDLSSIKCGKNSWMYSSRLDKVFIKMSQTFTVDISFKPHRDEMLYLRAMIVYSSSEDIHNPVLRCHNHENQTENGNLPHSPNRVSHILRCTRPDTVYHGTKQGVLFNDRLAAIIPLGRCASKSDDSKMKESVNFEFVCQNSCATGINRRPTVVIFSLEKEDQEILGKRLMSFKVCSAPKRDKEKEESIDREKNVLAGVPNDAIKRPDPFEKKPSKKIAISEIKREMPPQLLSPQNSNDSLDSNLNGNGGKSIRLELILPDIQSAQHILRCSFNEVSGRMALDKGLKNELFTPYLKHIKKQMDQYNAHPTQLANKGFRNIFRNQKPSCVPLFSVTHNKNNLRKPSSLKDFGKKNKKKH